jgi:hypothetical protein
MERFPQDFDYIYQISARRGSLDDLLVESIDETLTELLGRQGRAAVYDRLVQNHFFPGREIIRNLDSFLTLLRSTFGRGSEVIGKVILRKLYSKLDWEFVEMPEYEFTDYLRNLRARIAWECIQLARANAIH